MPILWEWIRSFLTQFITESVGKSGLHPVLGLLCISYKLFLNLVLLCDAICNVAVEPEIPYQRLNRLDCLNLDI
jgi:hypothetical protein